MYLKCKVLSYETVHVPLCQYAQYIHRLYTDNITASWSQLHLTLTATSLLHSDSIYNPQWVSVVCLRVLSYLFARLVSRLKAFAEGFTLCHNIPYGWDTAIQVYTLLITITGLLWCLIILAYNLRLSTNLVISVHKW